MCSLKKHVLNLEQKHHLPVFCSCCFPENPPTEAARCFFVLRSHLPVLALRSCLAQPHVCSYDVVGGSICGRVCQRWPLLPSQRWCLVKIVGGCLINQNCFCVHQIYASINLISSIERDLRINCWEYSGKMGGNHFRRPITCMIFSIWTPNGQRKVLYHGYWLHGPLGLKANFQCSKCV